MLFRSEFRVKQDAVPGMHTKIWFEGNKVGNWEIACAELCGLGHFRMKGFVTVETTENFQKWLVEQAAEQSTGQPQAAQDIPKKEIAPAAAPAVSAEKGGSS